MPETNKIIDWMMPVADCPFSGERRGKIAAIKPIPMKDRLEMTTVTPIVIQFASPRVICSLKKSGIIAKTIPVLNRPYRIANRHEPTRWVIR